MTNVGMQPLCTSELYFSIPNLAQADESISAERLKMNVHRTMSELETEWLVFEKNSRCSPFQRFSWIRALYQDVTCSSQTAKYTSKAPFILTGHLDDQLVFILPMVLETSLLGKHLKWVGSVASDYNGMILDADYATKMPSDLFQDIIKEIQESVPDLDAVYLKRNFASQDVINGKTISSWETEYASHTLDLSQNWKSLYARTRSKKSMQRLRSKYRALKKTGSITFKQVRNDDDRIESTKQILDWKSNQLKKRGSRDPFRTQSNPSQTRMAIISSVRDSSNTSAKVFGIFRNDELVAGMLAFINDGKFFYLVSAYSPEVPKKFSIGTQLLVKTLEFAARSGLRQYDFLLGDETYKFDWCDARVKLVNHLISFTLKGSFFKAGIRTGYFMKKLVLRSPKLSSFGQQVIKASRGILFLPSNRTSTTASLGNSVQHSTSIRNNSKNLTDQSLSKESG